MEDKKKDKDTRTTEVKKVKEDEQRTSQPGQEEFSLLNVSYAPGENNYLNEKRSDESQ